MQETIDNLRKREQKEKDKRVFKTIISIVSFVVLSQFIVLGFFVGKTKVQQDSMWPSFKSGDKVYYDKTLKEYQRNDVVIAYIPQDGYYVIKRVIGVPGDTIEIKDGIVYINGIKEKEYKNEDDTLVFNYKFNWEDEWKYTEMYDDYQITLEDNCYFLLGDNRTQSRDSRNYGPVKGDYILGKVIKAIRGDLL